MFSSLSLARRVLKKSSVRGEPKGKDRLFSHRKKEPNIHQAMRVILRPGPRLEYSEMVRLLYSYLVSHVPTMVAISLRPVSTSPYHTVRCYFSPRQTCLPPLPRAPIPFLAKLEKRVLPYVKGFVTEVCEEWPGVKGFIACHYSRRVPATTRDFRRAFGFAFSEDGDGLPVAAAEAAGMKMEAFGGAGAFLMSLGLDRLLTGKGSGMGEEDNVDPLAKVPEEDLATLNFVNEFVVKYGLADED